MLMYSFVMVRRVRVTKWWFAGQAPEVQAAVNAGTDAARPILERMAGGAE